MTGATSRAETAYPSEALEFTPVVSRVCVGQTLVFFVLFCKSMFVPLSFSIWLL